MEINEADVETVLARLRDAPVHPGLSGCSAVVVARTTALAEVQPLLRVGPFAAIAAISMGVAAAAVPSAPVEATPALATFGPAPPLAPSTLLLGRQ